MKKINYDRNFNIEFNEANAESNYKNIVKKSRIIKADLRNKYLNSNNKINFNDSKFSFRINNSINFTFENLNIYTKLQNISFGLNQEKLKNQELDNTIINNNNNNISILHKHINNNSNNNYENNIEEKITNIYVKGNILSNQSKLYLNESKNFGSSINNEKGFFFNNLNQTFDNNLNQIIELNENNIRNSANISLLNSYNANEFKHLLNNMNKENSRMNEFLKSYNDSAFLDLKKSKDFFINEYKSPILKENINLINKNINMNKSLVSTNENKFTFYENNNTINNNVNNTLANFNSIETSFDIDNYLNGNLNSFKEFISNELRRIESLTDEINSEKIVLENLKKAIESKINQEKISNLKVSNAQNASFNNEDMQNSTKISSKFFDIIEDEKNKLRTKENFNNNIKILFEKIYGIITDLNEFLKENTNIPKEFQQDSIIKRITNVKNQIKEYYKFIKNQVYKNGNENILDYSNEKNNYFENSANNFYRSHSYKDKGYSNYEYFYRKHKISGSEYDNYT